MYKFELLLTRDNTTKEDWRRFFNVVSTRAKGLNPVTLDVIFDGAIVRYFTTSKKDLSHISNGLEGFLLIPMNEEALEKSTPPSGGGFFFMRPSKFASLLDIKEKYVVKKGYSLNFARFKVRRLFGYLRWKRTFYFDFHGTIKKNTNEVFTLEEQILEVDFMANSSYVKKRINNYLDIEKTAPLFSTRKENALLKIDTFPYTTRDHYVHLSEYEFDKHSFIVGSSGSGKSRFIELFIQRLYETNMNMNYRVIVIDPHDSLREDLAHLPDTRIVNFSKEGASLFPEAEADITASTELTATLLLDMMSSKSARLERVLRFSTFVLFVAQAMSLSNLKRFVTDLDARTQILEHVKGYIPENIEHFFGTEFNEIRTQYYVEAIQPIVALVDEMELQPTLSAGGDISISAMVKENFLTVFSLNKVRMGEKVVKTVAGLLIQQIFLLAQSRSFGTKVLLFVDEVSVVQNPTLAAILAEARKFGMSVILTQQYFGQVETNLQQAILSNAINYYVFKVSEEDARILEGNLSMEIPTEIIESELKNGHSESDIRVKLMTELHPRDCIVRVASGGKVLPAIKARTMDIGPSDESKYQKNQDLEDFDRKELPGKFSYSTEPKKFAELPTQNSSPVATAPEPIAQVAQAPAPQPSAPSPTSHPAPATNSDGSGNRPGSVGQRGARTGTASNPTETMSMAELLASQSSSRFKQTPPKEDQETEEGPS